MVGRVAQYSPAAGGPQELKVTGTPMLGSSPGRLWLRCCSTAAAQSRAGLHARLLQAEATAICQMQQVRFHSILLLHPRQGGKCLPLRFPVCSMAAAESHAVLLP